MSSHGNSVIKSVKKDSPKELMIIVSWERILFRQKWKYTYRQWMSKDVIVYLLIRLFLDVPWEYINRNGTNLDTNECIFFCKWTAKDVCHVSRPVFIGSYLQAI